MIEFMKSIKIKGRNPSGIWILLLSILFFGCYGIGKGQGLEIVNWSSKWIKFGLENTTNDTIYLLSPRFYSAREKKKLRLHRDRVLSINGIIHLHLNDTIIDKTYLPNDWVAESRGFRIPLKIPPQESVYWKLYFSDKMKVSCLKLFMSVSEKDKARYKTISSDFIGKCN